MISIVAAAVLSAIALSPDELSRLDGHAVAHNDDGTYTISNVAGEGKPLVGVVQRKGQQLWLRVDASGSTYRLTGPLARPRIAGPGYRVWVLGEVDGDELRARRIGVLSPPVRR